MIDFLSALFRSLSPLWEMSLTGAYAAAILIVLRLALKKRAPRQVLCLLWLVVFARLLIPVSLESPLSIVPEARPAQEQIYTPRQEEGQNPADPAAPVQNPAQGQHPGTAAGPAISDPNPGEPVLTPPQGVDPIAPQPEAPASFPWQSVLAGVWLAGVTAMAGCGLISYLRLRRRLFDAIRAEDGAWEHPAVNSPFILGMLRPRIYLPAGLAGRSRQFILCHERAHLRRLDHIVKPVCWAALAIHWFNPLVWAAYLLMSRDIEAACDEAVIRRLGSAVKADYSATLLALATGRRLPTPSPLAFDEGDAKGRIKNVLGYRRPALWAIVVSVIAAVLAAVCLLTDPVAAQNPDGDPNPEPSAGASATQPPEPSLSDALLDPWMREVLDGERQFIRAYSQYNQGNGQTSYSIHQLNTFYYGEPVNTTVEAGKLAVIDLDRDGVNELVIWPEGEDEYLYSVVGYAILRRQGDEIYAYNPGYRTFGDLKSDGTFTFSSSADNWGIMTAGFLGGRFEFSHDNVITWCESDGGEIGYFVDGRKATRAEFYDAIDIQDAKPEPVWYVYEAGQLQPYLPGGAVLLTQTNSDYSTGTAKLWTGEYSQSWLEWNGVTCQLGTDITAQQSPFLYARDFDGDGQDEVVLVHDVNGFPELDLYEWGQGQPSLAAAYDAQQILLRFNQNNVAGYNKDSRGLTVTYAHTEGDPDSEDYDRRYVTGSTTLPEDFFDSFERIWDSCLHGAGGVYANRFQVSYMNKVAGCYPNDANEFCFDFEFYLADETMRELERVDTLLDSDYSGHYMAGKPVGFASFTLRYNGTQWVLQEPDQLNLSEAMRDELTPMDITTAAPLSAPVADLMDELPDDPNEWYKVAELPDDMIWVYARNRGAQTLIRWDGNLYKAFDRTAHTARSIPPALKKLGRDPNFYGPLAVISNVDSGTGVSLDELAVYELDVSGVPSYVHDWKPLVDNFNANCTYRWDSGTQTITCAYEGQTAELIIDGGEEMFRRIDKEGVRLTVTGETVSYRFNEDGAIQIEFPLQAFIGSDVVNAPLIWPWFLRWTIRFDSGRAEFETVPGSCELFTYAGQ